MQVCEDRPVYVHCMYTVCTHTPYMSHSNNRLSVSFSQNRNNRRKLKHGSFFPLFTGERERERERVNTHTYTCKQIHPIVRSTSLEQSPFSSQMLHHKHSHARRGHTTPCSPHISHPTSTNQFVG